MAPRAQVHRLPMSGPGDVSAIGELIDRGRLDPLSIVAILGKTEGNGCVNDFTRGYATLSLRQLFAALAPAMDVDRVSLIMSGGTEGGLSPHWLVIAVEDTPGAGADSPALAAATAMTALLPATAIGRRAQSEAVRDATRAAIQAADIAGLGDVHFVQIKCPLLSSTDVADGGAALATTDVLHSMGLSRGASALGVALALGEVPDARVTDEAIGRDASLWSSRASSSAGIELKRCEVTVLGMSAAFTGPLAIAHTVMNDAIDAAAITDLLSRELPGAPLPLGETASSVAAVLCKAEASKSGTIRGRRHTMLNDSDIASTRHARGFVGGLLAGLVGETALFVSGGAEHQGPDGGGPFALIYQRSE